jgi:hypothetical protein
MASFINRFGRLALSTGIMLAAAGTAGMLTPARTALAQEMMFAGPGGGMGGMGGAEQEPPFNTKMLARYADMLGMDEAQREAATALLEGMQAEHQAIGKKMREKMDEVRAEFQESRDPSVFTNKVPGAMRELGMARGKLEQGFVSDLKSLLTTDQEAKWPIVARSIRRERTMSQSRLAGEGVDIIRLVEDMKLPAEVESKIRPMLEQYEVDLDRPLAERNDLQTQARNVGPGDQEALEKIRDQAREARVRIKEINERYARQIQPELPSDLAGKFRSEFEKRAFPEIYDNTHTADSARAALAFEDLSAEQKATIQSIRESYERDAARLNEQWARSLEEWQKSPEGYRASLMPNVRMISGGDGAQPSDPTAEPRQARLDLDKKAFEQIKGVLTDSQRERLPKRPERRRGGPDFMGMRGSGGSGTTAGAGGEPAVFIVQGDPANAPPSGAAIGVIHEVVTDDKGNVIHERTATTLDPQSPEPGGEEEEVEVVAPAPPPAPEPPAKPQ